MGRRDIRVSGTDGMVARLCWEEVDIVKGTSS